MATHAEIKASLADVMKSRDAVKLRTVRSMITAFTNESAATGGTPQDFIDEAATMAIIKRLSKQRKDSIEQYEAAGRPELAAPEKEELVVLESYLPQMMSQDEIRPIAEAKKAELGVDDKSKIGILIGAVMKETAGQADGGDVKEVVESLFE